MALRVEIWVFFK